MLRNTQTTIDKLQPGDRFYKSSDKKKQLWTVVESDKKTTYLLTHKFYGLKDGQRHPEPISTNTLLIFLKNKTD